MIDLEQLRKDPDYYKQAARNKQRDPAVVDLVLNLDERRRSLIQKVEVLRAERNQLSEGREGKPSEEELRKAREIKAALAGLEPELADVVEELNLALQKLPNPPAEDVPVGVDESENEVKYAWGEKRDFKFDPLSYQQLGEKLGLVDTNRAAKVSGSRFGYLLNEAVLLEFALVRFTLATLTLEGFVPVVPPVMIREKAMRGMGYLEHGGEEETYHFEKDGLYLIGTSEQAIGPMHMDEVLDLDDLPLRYVAFSTCFRREAGSYGKDTKGIFRVHQFDKVEMFSFAAPKDSDSEHEYLLSLQERLVQALGIPYQVTKMCTGDLGDPAARKYDINCWFPSEQCYRETHSTSTCTDYQARRLNIKYRTADGESDFVHTLNGTAFAIGRTILAILENYQQEDGSVVVPDVLKEFVGKDVIRLSS